MIQHSQISDKELRVKIKNKIILYGGNNRAKIYGNLSCSSGKKLDRDNRAFFTSEEKARHAKYRPCGHCMRQAYVKWKDGIV